MTGTGDLGALFGHPQQATPEQAAHAEKVCQAMREAELAAFAQVQFFAPVLCGCPRRYDWGNPAPPQAGCVVHGHLHVDGGTGQVLMFGIPGEW